MMLDKQDIEKQIGITRMDAFVPWRAQHTTALANATHPDATKRLAAFRELVRIYDSEGRQRIQDSFSRIIGLQTALAKAEGTTIHKKFFHEGDAVSEGIKIIHNKASEVLDRYFGFKARLLNKNSLTPPDIFMPIGNWGEDKISWDETKQTAVASFEPLGLSDVATDITKNQGGAGQKFWNDFVPRLEQFSGLMGPRIATHEMGHAVHYTQAGRNFSNPDLAEIVSLFSEALFMKEMQKRPLTPAQKMALLSNQLDVDVETVGQAEKLVFERNAYEFAQNHPNEPIPVEKLWRDAGGRMLENSLEQSDETTKMMDARLMMWDQYIHVPGYGSGYLIGWAAAPKLMEKLEADPEGFKKTFQDTIKKGDSITAEQFLQAFGIDVNQPEFWQDRLQKMSQTVEQLEQTHRQQALASFVNPATGSARSRTQNGSA